MTLEIIKINDYIYAFDQEMVRCFLIIGEKSALLLDAGVESFDIISEIRKITSKPLQLCLTHSDGDHTANVNQFDVVYVHKDEVPYLNLDKHIQMITIDDGYCFDLGDRKLEVIHSPGHTPGSICLFNQEDKVLFSGDTISYGPVYMFGHNRNLEQYLKTLLKLQELFHDKNLIIYPAHNTFPVSTNEISELIKCVEGVIDQGIQGTKTNIISRDQYSPLLYQYGKCGIYK